MTLYKKFAGETITKLKLVHWHLSPSHSEHGGNLQLGYLPHSVFSSWGSWLECVIWVQCVRECSLPVGQSTFSYPTLNRFTNYCLLCQFSPPGEEGKSSSVVSLSLWNPDSDVLCREELPLLSPLASPLQSSCGLCLSYRLRWWSPAGLWGCCWYWDNAGMSPWVVAEERERYAAFPLLFHQVSD